MHVRAERAKDRPSIDELHLGAFESAAPTVCGLVDALRQSPAFEGGVSLVAEDDGEVIGHVMLSHGLLDAPRELVDVQILSPLGVLPARQRAGVGAALVRAALQSATDRRVPVVFLEGAAPFYARFGFEAGAGLGFRRPSLRIPDAAFQALTFPTYEPWMTGTLVYPDVCWQHDAVGLRDPGA